MPRQWVAIKFRDTDAKSFTYHNDGDPVKVGDLIKVPDRSGDGWKRVRVCDLPFDPPKFATKEILGLWEPVTPPQAGEAATAPPAGVQTVDDLFAKATPLEEIAKPAEPWTGPRHKPAFPDGAPEDDLRNHL